MGGPMPESLAAVLITVTLQAAFSEGLQRVVDTAIAGTRFSKTSLKTLPSWFAPWLRREWIERLSR